MEKIFYEFIFFPDFRENIGKFPDWPTYQIPEIFQTFQIFQTSRQRVIISSKSISNFAEISE